MTGVLSVVFAIIAFVALGLVCWEGFIRRSAGGRSPWLAAATGGASLGAGVAIAVDAPLILLLPAWLVVGVLAWLTARSQEGEPAR